MNILQLESVYRVYLKNVYVLYGIINIEKLESRVKFCVLVFTILYHDMCACHVLSSTQLPLMNSNPSVE